MVSMRNYLLLFYFKNNKKNKEMRWIQKKKTSIHYLFMEEWSFGLNIFCEFGYVWKINVDFGDASMKCWRFSGM